MTFNTAGFAVTNATAMTGAGGFTKFGPGALNLSGANTYLGATNVRGGVLVLQQDTAVPSGNNVIVAGGATLVAPDQAAVTRMNSLNVNGNVIVHGGSLSTITALAQTAYNNGWSGTSGLFSSAAATDPSHLTAIGVVLNSTTGTFEGQPVAAGDILVKDTYFGDANLDGQVNSADYTQIDAGFLSQGGSSPLSGWQNGDFNYDNVINGSDYTLIDNAFNTQGAQLSAQVATPTAEFAGTSAVPEPATLGLVGFGLLGLLGRRRRTVK